ncbi:GtrA family protein [Rothia sp. HC945]|uniref:GtrA family protein n=1 Tax=Rothia sp. HC945 TaxID=3171170 RepID=UPI0026551EB8|nr:GtrA family protein [Kocuria sp.]MDN5618011.1 GtrA family protein [Kocuria sp.]
MSTVAEKVRGLWDLFLKEVLKFGIVGALAFVVNATVTLLLMNTWFQDEGHAKAKFIAGVVATLFSWIVNRLWTFRHKRQENKFREAIQFAVVNLIGIGVESGCVMFTFYVLGLTSKEASFVSGTIVGTVLGTIVRYFAYRYWVYGGQQREDIDQDRDHMTREEQVGRFVTEATEIVTGTLDADEVVRRSKSRGPSDASPEE